MGRALVMCFLLLVCALPAIGSQVPPDPFVGTWTGVMHSGDVSKTIGLRFDVNAKGDKVVFMDMPDLRFHNIGPFPLKQEGENYAGGGFNLKLASEKSITGTLSFDGNDLTFEVQPGPLPGQPGPANFTAPIAQPKWTFKTAAAVWGSPIVADGIVYFGSNDGNIYALKAGSGQQVWQFKTGGPVIGRPTIEGTYLYSLSDDGFLYKLDRRTSKLVWKFDTHGGSIKRDWPSPKTEGYDYLTSSATVEDGIVYIGSADKKLYALNAKTGEEKWNFETKGIVRSTPAVVAGRVIIGSHDYNVYAVDARTGALSWKYDTKREVVSSPLVVNGTVYIGSRCSDLFAFDAETGKVRWKYFYWTSWVESSARFRDGKLYVGSSDAQQLFAIDPATGKRIWNANLDGSVWSSPAVTEQHVFVGVIGTEPYFLPHHGGFFAVDRSSGSVLWRFPMTKVEGLVDYGVASSPAVDNGLVFFGGLDGTFYAFKVSG